MLKIESSRVAKCDRSRRAADETAARALNVRSCATRLHRCIDSSSFKKIMSQRSATLQASLTVIVSFDRIASTSTVEDWALGAGSTFAVRIIDDADVMADVMFSRK
mmetsp:Transcript_14989/g.38181  ORF Transcript_14989/g.38181 Transcript_14989/m.38181 type:complete len:106 (+) Transcript_14989:68-385(+)